MKILTEVTSKIVVVGAGQFGKNHVRVLNELGAIGCVVDKDIQLAKSFGKLYGVPWYDNIEGLSGDKFDGAIVATPTVTHYNIAKELIFKGISHILIEKPFTATLDEAYTLTDIVNEHEAFLMVGFIERFNQAINFTIKSLSENAIGKSLIYNATRIRRWPERPIDIGVVKDSSIHDIDLVNYIRGGIPDSVFAKTGNTIHKSFEDHATMVLYYNTGERAILESNWITPYKVRRFTITGIEGVIDSNLITQEVTIGTQKGVYSPFIEWKEPLKYELQSFINSIRENKIHSPDALDGINALKVAEAALKSSFNNQIIDLN